MIAYSLWSGRRRDPDRAVQILSQAGTKQIFGTGYRVTDELVLTAAHVLPGALATAIVWREGGPSVAGSVRWWRPDLDLALLYVPQAVHWGPVAPVAWGRIDRATSVEGGVPFSFLGYPAATTLHNVPSKDDRSGVIPPLSYAEHNLYALYVSGPAPRRPDATKTLWEGVSGAAVFSAGLLVAVVRSDQTSTEPGELLASPIETAVSDETFRQLVGISALAELPRSPLPAAPEHPAEVLLWRLPDVTLDEITRTKQELEARGLAVRVRTQELAREQILQWVVQADAAAQLCVLIPGYDGPPALVWHAVNEAQQLTANHPEVRIAAVTAGDQAPAPTVTVLDPKAGLDALVAWCLGIEVAEGPPPSRAARRAPRMLDPYPLSTSFVGRRRERVQLGTWLAQRQSPVMVVEAIGGTGKSALAWTWLTADVLGSPSVGTDLVTTPATELDGAFWFTFYRTDASARTFVRSLLSYLRPAWDQSELPLSDAVEVISEILHQERVLIVMDGLERELRAFSRLDAARLPDEEVAEADRGKRSATDPIMARLLRLFCDSTLRGKILITTRMVPSDLEDISGSLSADCTLVRLTDFDAEDVLRLFRNLRVRGTDKEILDACRPYGFHPLTVRLLAGLVVEDLRDPRDIRVARRKTARPTTAVRRVHVLEDSFQALDDDQQLVLTRISATRTPMTYALIEALASFADVERVETALSGLIARGLVMLDPTAGTFDLHPIVRGYAYDMLQGRPAVHEQIAEAIGDSLDEVFEYLEDPPDERVALEIFAGVAPTVVELFYQFVLAGALDEAAEMWTESLASSLPAMGEYGTALSCLETLCGNEDKLREEIDSALTRTALRAQLAEMAVRLGRPRYALEVLRRQRTDEWVDPDDDELDELVMRCMAMSVEARACFLLGMVDRSERLVRSMIDDLTGVDAEVSARYQLETRQLMELEGRMLLVALYQQEGRTEEAREQARLHGAGMRSMLRMAGESGADVDEFTRLMEVAAGLTERTHAIGPAAGPGSHTEAHRVIAHDWREWLREWLQLMDQQVGIDAAQRIMLRLQFIGITQAMLTMGVDLADDEAAVLETTLEEALRDARRTGATLAELPALMALAELRSTQNHPDAALQLAEEALLLAQRNELVPMTVAAYVSLARVSAAHDPAAAQRFLAQAEQTGLIDGKQRFAQAIELTRPYLAKAITG